MLVIKDLLGGIQAFSSKDELKCWIRGAMHAAWAFGTWKDGVVYVGSTGRTYKEIVSELKEQYKEITKEPFDS